MECRPAGAILERSGAARGGSYVSAKLRSMGWNWANIDWTTTGTLAAAWVQAVGSIAAVAGAAGIAVWTARDQRMRDQAEKAEVERRVATEAAEALMLVSNLAGAGASMLILMLDDLERGEDVMEICSGVAQGMNDLHEEAAHIVPLQIPGHGGRSYASLVKSGVKSAVDGAKSAIEGMRIGGQDEEFARHHATVVFTRSLEALRDAKHGADAIIATKVPRFVPVDLDKIIAQHRERLGPYT